MNESAVDIPADVLCSAQSQCATRLMMTRQRNTARFMCTSSIEPFSSEPLPSFSSFQNKEAFTRTPLSIWSIIRLGYCYTLSSVIRRPRDFIIGLLSVVVLVFFTGIVILAIQKIPYVFLRLGELSLGEMDMVITGGGGNIFLNYTEMLQAVKKIPEVKGIVPRWLFPATATKENYILSSSTPYSNGVLPTNISHVNILVLDSALEEEVGVGRAWKHREIGYAESHVFYSVLNYLKIRPNRGERLKIDVILDKLLGSSANNMIPSDLFNVSKPTDISDPLSLMLFLYFERNGIQKDNINLLNFAQIAFPLNAVDEVREAKGKYPSNLGNVLLMDYKYLIPHLVRENRLAQPPFLPHSKGRSLNWVLSPLHDKIVELLSTVDLLNYVPIIFFVLNNKQEIYYKSSGARNRDIVKISNSIMRQVMTSKTSARVSAAIMNGEVSYPIFTFLEKLETLRSLLVASLLFIVCGIIIISVLLFYVIFHIYQHEKMYEFSLLKIQGLNNKQFIFIFMFSSVFFIFPGTCIGLLLLFLVNMLLEGFLSRLTVFSPLLYVNSTNYLPFLISALVGILLPFLINVFPLVTLIRNNFLGADLQAYKSNSSGGGGGGGGRSGDTSGGGDKVKVKKIKVQSVHINLWEFILSVFFIFIGFVVYYLIPYSFMFDKLVVLFFLIDILLMFMILGLCFMFCILEGTMKRVSLWVFLLISSLCMKLWRKIMRRKCGGTRIKLREKETEKEEEGDDRKFKMIILRNMRCNQGRNSKIFIMLLINISVLISSFVMFTLLSRSAENTVYINNGADVLITSSHITHPIDEATLTAFLRTKKGTIVESWSYQSFSLQEYPQIQTPTMLESVVKIGCPMEIVTVSKNLLQTTYPKFVMVKDTIPADTSDGGKKDKKKKKGHDVVKNLFEYKPTNNGINNSQIIVTGLPSTSSSSRSSNSPDDKENILNKKNHIIPLLMASSVFYDIGSTVDSMLILEYKYVIADFVRVTRFNTVIHTLVNRFSGFPDLISLPSSLQNSQVIVSNKNFLLLINPWNIDFKNNSNSGSSGGTNVTLVPNAIKDIRQKKLFIKFAKHSTKKDHIILTNEIQAYIDTAYHSVSNTNEQINQIDVIREFIMYFFYFTAVICFIFSILMMWITFTTNVKMNKETLVILRTLGCKKWEAARLIIYEALVIVCSAFFLGLIIGIIVGIVLGYQMMDIMIVPLQFQLPYLFIFILFVLNIIAAVVGSLIPFYEIGKKNINAILRTM